MENGIFFAEFITDKFFNTNNLIKQIIVWNFMKKLKIMKTLNIDNWYGNDYDFVLELFGYKQWW